MATQYALTKKILSFTFPLSLCLLLLINAWENDRIRAEREREQRQSQRHKREWVTKQIPGWDLRALLPVLISIPRSSGFCQSRTQQPYSPRREPAGHYPQTPRTVNSSHITVIKMNYILKPLLNIERKNQVRFKTWSVKSQRILLESKRTTRRENEAFT